LLSKRSPPGVSNSLTGSGLNSANSCTDGVYVAGNLVTECSRKRRDAESAVAIMCVRSADSRGANAHTHLVTNWPRCCNIAQFDGFTGVQKLNRFHMHGRMWRVVS
jgi:hypothetical protein